MTDFAPVQIYPAVLCGFIRDIFLGVGIARVEADAVAHSLVLSNLCGHESHGVLRVAEYLEQLRSGELSSGLDWKVLCNAPALLVADGRRGFGQVLARRLCEGLVEKCRAAGVACGTLKNSGHIGRLGEWVELAARQGMAAMLSVNDNGVLRCVAPPGGLEPRISTNPLAIGIPTDTDPLVLDISTSAAANGKIKAAMLAGRACPIGWLQDACGNSTTDPEVRFRDPPGTLLPMGGEHQGYKGFGLGLVLDILVGGLSGGWCPPAEPPAIGTNNVLMLMWNPEFFAGREHFECEARKLIDYVRATPLKPGVDAVILPGDRSQAIRTERLKSGVPLDRGTWDTLRSAANQAGVSCPEIIARQ